MNPFIVWISFIFSCIAIGMSVYNFIYSLLQRRVRLKVVSLNLYALNHDGYDAIFTVVNVGTVPCLLSAAGLLLRTKPKRWTPTGHDLDDISSYTITGKSLSFAPHERRIITFSLMHIDCPDWSNVDGLYLTTETGQQFLHRRQRLVLDWPSTPPQCLDEDST